MAEVNELKIAEVISRYRILYQKITPVFSPVINDKVYFNIRGFKHLIYKGGHRRDNRTIYNRMVLVPLIVPVIKNCTEEVEIRIKNEIIDGVKVKVTYYALEAIVGNDSARVRVVIKKIGDKGNYYFQSIMKYN